MFCLLEECLTLCSRGSPFKFSEIKKQHDTNVAFGIFFVKKKFKLCIVSVCLISIIAFFKVFNITYGVNLSTNTWKIYSIVIHIVLYPYTVYFYSTLGGIEQGGPHINNKYYIPVRTWS